MNRCYKSVAQTFECLLCKKICKKNGKTRCGKQRYKCNCCSRTFVANYKNLACGLPDNDIKILVKEGCGIRSISRILTISATTVLKRILKIAKSIIKPVISFYKSYEVDELRTYYQNKGRLLWIVYALQRENNTVADFAVGTRTKTTLEKVMSTLLLSSAVKVHTDKLNLYKYIIPSCIHSSKQYGTNNIERKNLSLRTHLKRLNRRTICYSKNITMLAACLKIYFWG